MSEKEYHEMTWREKFRSIHREPDKLHLLAEKMAGLLDREGIADTNRPVSVTPLIDAARGRT